jgi:hypothetical protein
VHDRLHFGLNILRHDGEGGGVGKSGEQFRRQGGGDFGFAVFFVDGDAAGQGDVHAHVFGQDLGGLLRIAHFEDVARVRQRKSFRGERFFQIVSAEDAEAVRGDGGAEVFDGDGGCFVGFDDVAHEVRLRRWHAFAMGDRAPGARKEGAVLSAGVASGIRSP